jgi:hypothetical protein
MKKFNPETPKENAFFSNKLAPTEGGKTFKKGQELESAVLDVLIGKTPEEKVETVLNVLQAMCLTWKIKIQVGKQTGALIFTDVDSGKTDYIYPDDINKYL